MRQSEHLRVAVLDDDGRPRQRRQLGHRVAQRAVEQAARQIGQGLALDRGHDLPVDLDGVVARRQPAALGVHVPAPGLPGEAVRVALVAVDEHGQPLHPLGPPGRQRHVRPGLPGRARGLPEDGLPAAADPGDDELGAVLPAAVEHEVDGGTAALAAPHRHPLDDLGVGGPALGSVAVHLRRARPGVAHLEHDAVRADGDPYEVRQRRRGIGVARDDEVVDHGSSVPHLRRAAARTVAA